MGYRSEVRIVTTTKGYEELEKTVKEPDNLLLYCDVRLFANDLVYFGWDWIKWYDDFTEVKEIKNALENIYNKNYSYCFARIGDDWEDVENNAFKTENEGSLPNPIISVKNGNILVGGTDKIIDTFVFHHFEDDKWFEEQKSNETIEININENASEEWIKICKKYCNDRDVSLLFVGENDFGYETANHKFVHLDWKELYNDLNKKSKDKDDDYER